MDQQDKVPYYVLVSPSSQTQSPAATGSTTPVLIHPVLQYHYANDSPLSLLPISPNEHVLVLDYDTLTPQCARAQSISGSSAVTGIKVTEAPGAASAEGSAGWCNNMFVLETTTFDSRFVGHVSLGHDIQSEILFFEEFLQMKAILGRYWRNLNKSKYFRSLYPQDLQYELGCSNAIIQKVLDYETTTSELQETMTQTPAVGETEGRGT